MPRTYAAPPKPSAPGGNAETEAGGAALYRATLAEAERHHDAITACQCHRRPRQPAVLWWPGDLRCDACRAHFRQLEAAWGSAEALLATLQRDGVVCRDEGCLEAPVSGGWCAEHGEEVAW